MDWKIGEIRQVNGEWYQCLKSKGACSGCIAFGKNYSFCRSFGECTGDTIFKKLEKVGKPYEKRVSDGSFSTFQRYRVYNSVILPKEPYIYCNFIDGTIEIEIKQKENMEENKTPLPREDNALTRTIYAYVNGKISDKELIRSIKEMSDEYPYDKNGLKPFSLEAAKAGKPVCTRDGRKARIICWDIEYIDNPIAAAVFMGECETVYLYTDKGEYNKGKEDELDLMMLPEKKEGWIIVSKNATIYDSLEEARKSFDSDKELCICKVE